MPERLKIALDELSAAQLRRLLLMRQEQLDVINWTNNELIRRLHELPDFGDDARAVLNEWSSVMNELTDKAIVEVARIVGASDSDDAAPPSLN